MAYIEFKLVCKNYDSNEKKIKALKKASFEIEKGQLVAITGPSLSGKTTILNILGGLDKQTSGNVIVDGISLDKLKGRKLTKYRRNYVGLILDDFNLLNNLTLLENVELSSQISKEKKEPTSIIKKLSLTKKKDDFIYMLTKEEKKKTLIARAICKNPKLILCDNTTDNLDEKSKKQVLKLLQSLSKKDKTTIIIATNDESILPIANKIITLKNGTISDVKVNKKPKSVGDLTW